MLSVTIPEGGLQGDLGSGSQAYCASGVTINVDQHTTEVFDIFAVPCEDAPYRRLIWVWQSRLSKEVLLQVDSLQVKAQVKRSLE